MQTISPTNLANWIPIVWAKESLSALENSLVLGSLVDRRFEASAVYGDTIVIPNLSNLAAKQVNTAVDTVAYDVLQTVTNISINKKWDVAVAVDDFNQVQTNPKYFADVVKKLTYCLAQVIDSNVSDIMEVGWTTTPVGTQAQALTEDVLIAAYEALNDANIPANDRAWVFDPQSITDLLKNDYFIRMDYVPGSVVSQGFQGRQIFGAPVYISTNLAVCNVNYHAASYFQKEGLALVMQIAPRLEVFRDGWKHADVITALTCYGINFVRSTAGVLIKTRS